MRLTVIFDDLTIIKDGEARVIPALSFPASDPNWHAIQWYGQNGTIEVKVGDRIWLDTDELLAPFVAAWAANPPAQSEPVEVI